MQTDEGVNLVIYAEPVFIKQPLKSRQRPDEEKFFDCEDDITSLLDIIETIDDPREFKCLLKEIAFTSEILYRCFSRAYHRVKKAKANETGASKHNKSNNKNPGKSRCISKIRGKICEEFNNGDRLPGGYFKKMTNRSTTTNEELTKKAKDEINNRVSGNHAVKKDGITFERYPDSECDFEFMNFCERYAKKRTKKQKNKPQEYTTILVPPSCNKRQHEVDKFNSQSEHPGPPTASTSNTSSLASKRGHACTCRRCHQTNSTKQRSHSPIRRDGNKNSQHSIIGLGPNTLKVPINLQIQTHGGENQKSNLEVKLRDDVDPISTAKLAGSKPEGEIDNIANKQVLSNDLRSPQGPKDANNDATASTKRIKEYSETSKDPQDADRKLIEKDDGEYYIKTTNFNTLEEDRLELTTTQKTKAEKAKSDIKATAAGLRTDITNLTSSVGTEKPSSLKSPQGTLEHFESSALFADTQTQTEGFNRKHHHFHHESSLSLFIEENLKQSRIDNQKNLHLLYFQGRGCFDLPITNLPRTNDFEEEVSHLHTQVSSVMQTESITSTLNAHLNRNDMRRNIIEELEDLLNPHPDLKSRYKPHEREEVLSYMHKLFAHSHVNLQRSVAESRESLMDDIRLLIHPRGKGRSISACNITGGRTWSSIIVGKSRSTQIIVKNIRHILNPKGGEKPSHRFSRDKRQIVLENLNVILKAHQQNGENCENVILELRPLLLKRHLIDKLKERNLFDPALMPLPSEYLDSDSELIDEQNFIKPQTSEKPLVILKDSEKKSSKDEEDIMEPEKRQKALLFLKDSEVNSSNDENDEDFKKMNHVELISPPKEKIEDNISSASTSSETFYLNLHHTDNKRPSAAATRLSQAARASRGWIDNIRLSRS